MKYAYININGVVKDIKPTLDNVAPILIDKYVEAPDHVQIGWIYKNIAAEGEPEVWDFVEAERVVKKLKLAKITPVQFKMLFTPQERRAIRQLRDVDSLIQEWEEILEDRRLTEIDLNLGSVQGVLKYLVAKSILSPNRAKQILSNREPNINVSSIEPPRVTPVQFKMLFTVSERQALKALVDTDSTIADWFEILNDPKLTVVDLSLPQITTILTYMVSINVLTAARAQEIKWAQTPSS